MLEIFKKKNSTMELVPQEHIPKNPLLQCLIFLGVFMLSQICASIPSVIPMMQRIFKNMNLLMDTLNKQGYQAYMEAVMSVGYDSTVMVLSLYGTILATILVLLFCKFIEYRPIASLGLRKGKIIKNYLVGCLVGAIMISLCVVLSAVFGGISLRVNPNINVSMLILFFIGFMFQGASEEIIFRGYFLNTVASKGRIVLGVALNSIFFGLAHSFNMGLTPLAMLNLILFGIFASVYAIKFDNLWGVCGIHALWNFMQGNFWGIQVSGTDTGTSVFLADTTPDSTLLNGGNFGLEGSIFVTVVLVVSIAIVLSLKPRDTKKPI